MKKIISLIKEYYIDLLFLVGVFIVSYNILRPPIKHGLGLSSLNFSWTEYFTGYKVFGIMLIAIAVDVAIRRYFKHKK